MGIIIKNGRVITPTRIISNGGISIINNKIDKVFEGNEIPSNKNDEVIDAGGMYISPGFIDIHTHGGGGFDFMDGTIESIKNGARAHMKYGTTTILPTTLTSTMEDLFSTLDNIRIVKKELKDGPNIMGIHLEGPYFSLEQKGAQDPKYIKTPQAEEYLKILDYSNDIVRWTIAPELPGALELGRTLRERGIKCSIGHSNAVYDEVLRAFENGYDLITHLYSGMSMVRRINAFRYSGVVESAYLIDDMYVEIIADGMHLPPSLLKLIYKIKGPEKICLVTDSMRAAGMCEGEYILGNIKNGQKVIVEDGVAKLIDKSAFAGSVATADRLVSNMIKLVNVPLLEAVKMMTYAPAQTMGIKNKGSISPGKDADIIIFDEDINVKKVIVNGNLLINN